MPLDNPVSEKIETITYNPSVVGGADLEGATKTITATSEAAGVGNADYSSALTLTAPTDARLVVLRIASRLAVTIDSMTAGTLYCRVYVDAQAANNRLFDLSWTTTGAKLAAVDTHAAAYAVIFALLKDGAAHTFYFFFWVDAGNAVLSVVRLWEAVGTCSLSEGPPDSMSLTHVGLVTAFVRNYVMGTGTPAVALHQSQQPDSYSNPFLAPVSAIFGVVRTSLAIVNNNLRVSLWGSVATDINFVYASGFELRSER